MSRSKATKKDMTRATSKSASKSKAASKSSKPDSPSKAKPVSKGKPASKPRSSSKSKPKSPSPSPSPSPSQSPVDEVRAPREAGRHEEHLAAARRLVAARPSDVLAQIEAAYGHDRNNLERQAIGFYDEAYRLGVPSELRRRFLVGYGSTLRNVGRLDDSIALLGQAVVDDPDYPAFTAFLALALLSAGHPKAAMATLLGCTLDVARKGVFDGYERALDEYQRELLTTD